MRLFLNEFTAATDQCRATLHDGVLQLLLDRPERKNALSLSMYTTLAEALLLADQSVDVRVIVLRGVGDNFTSGNDLADFMNEPEIHEAHPVVRFMRALTHVEKPVIALVQGLAVGIGTTLLLHCDLVYAGEGARLQLPFINLGLSPEYASSYLLPRFLGHVRASELLLFGNAISAQKAEQWGLVNAVVPDVELEDYGLARAAELARRPPQALIRSKSLLKISQQNGVDLAIAAEFIGFAEGLQSAECREAINAFFEKRAPDFSKIHAGTHQRSGAET